MLGHALRHLQDFTPQNLANAVWAIATLSLPVAKCKVRVHTAVVCGCTRRLLHHSAPHHTVLSMKTTAMLYNIQS